MFCVCERFVLSISGCKFLQTLGLCGLCLTNNTERPMPTHHPSKVIVSWCYGDAMQCAWSSRLVICYLTASTHYSSGALIPEYNGLSQFKEDIGRPSVPVREINFLA